MNWGFDVASGTYRWVAWPTHGHHKCRAAQDRNEGSWFNRSYDGKCRSRPLNGRHTRRLWPMAESVRSRPGEGWAEWPTLTARDPDGGSHFESASRKQDQMLTARLEGRVWQPERYDARLFFSYFEIGHKSGSEDSVRMNRAHWALVIKTASASLKSRQEIMPPFTVLTRTYMRNVSTSHAMTIEDLRLRLTGGRQSGAAVALQDDSKAEAQQRLREPARSGPRRRRPCRPARHPCRRLRKDCPRRKLDICPGRGTPAPVSRMCKQRSPFGLQAN